MGEALQGTEIGIEIGTGTEIEDATVTDTGELYYFFGLTCC